MQGIAPALSNNRHRGEQSTSTVAARYELDAAFRQRLFANQTIGAPSVAKDGDFKRLVRDCLHCFRHTSHVNLVLLSAT